MSEQTGRGQSSEQDDPRTLAEWTTLLVSLAIIVAAFAAVVYLYLTEDNDPIMIHAEAALEQIRETEEGFYVPVVVSNVGDAPATNVQIQADLTIGDEVESSGFSLLALSGNDTETGIVAFRQDPREGELVVRVASYIE
jgi:uncharacterized protein (TIGR02588 family)